MTIALWLILIVLALCFSWHWTALILALGFIAAFVLRGMVD